MLNAVLATIAVILWLAPYVMFFAQDARRWQRERPYRRMMNEMERLEAVRTYAAWVRNMPPAPVRGRPGSGALVIPAPVVPPLRDAIAPYPGRRLLGN